MKHSPKSPVKNAVAESLVPLADSDIADEHLTGFANNFIAKDRRERWLYFFMRRSPRAARDSPHRLETHLIAERCSYKRSVPEELLGRKGLIYDLVSSPAVCTWPEALEIIHGHDAIFSWVPGELALFQSHEGDWWLCKR